MMLGVPNGLPPVGKTCHTGGTGGGIDSPPPGLICCTEGVGEQNASGGFSVRTIHHGIPPQVTSAGHGWQESKNYTELVYLT